MKEYDFDIFDYFKPPFKNKVIGLAFNYKSLVSEKNKDQEPLIFLKSSTSLIFNNDEIIYNKIFNKIWIEAELCIIIGKEGKNIKAQNAKDYILGYTCGNDVTAENILNRDWHLARSKGSDTFAPIGPKIINGLDTSNLRIQSFINGIKKQDSTTSDRILNDYECVELVSTFMRLIPGDIIFTGTPAGATDAIVKPGDKVTIEIERIGKITNSIKIQNI